MRRIPPNVWFYLASLALLALLCGTLAVWQWREYDRDRRAALATIDRKAETVFHALVGGVRSHRRLGAFLDRQLGIFLDELVVTRDVLGVALYDQRGETVLGAGINVGNPAEKTELVAAGYRYVGVFEVAPPQPVGGPGAGRGPGWGRMRRGFDDDESRFAGGGTFRCVLLLDRSEFDRQCSRAAQLRTAVAVTGSLVLSFLWGGWLLVVQLVVARQRRRLAETRAEHWRDLSQAAAGLAHDTRNPLGIVRGWAQRLASGDLADQQREQAERIVEECDRITARINQFLSFTSTGEPRCEPTDPDRILAELTAVLAPDVREHDLHLRHIPAQSPQAVLADPEMLRQALFNLLHNAVRFTPPGGTIEVVAVPGDRGDCRIEVRDTGPGVPPENEPRLFTPYFTTRSDGTGLGLAIVRRIALAHSGRAGYRSRPGGGAVFWIEIPMDAR